VKRTIWLEVKDVLGEALDRPEEERDAFVRARCAGDAALCGHVVDMLAQRDRSVVRTGRAAELCGLPPLFESVGADGRARTKMASVQ